MSRGGTEDGTYADPETVLSLGFLSARVTVVVALTAVVNLIGVANSSPRAVNAIAVVGYPTGIKAADFNDQFILRTTTSFLSVCKTRRIRCSTSQRILQGIRVIKVLPVFDIGLGKIILSIEVLVNVVEA